MVKISGESPQVNYLCIQGQSKKSRKAERNKDRQIRVREVFETKLPPINALLLRSESPESPCTEESEVAEEAEKEWSVTTLPATQALVNEWFDWHFPVDDSQLQISWIGKDGQPHFETDCAKCGHKIIDISKQVLNKIILRCNPSRCEGVKGLASSLIFLYFKNNEGKFRLPVELLSLIDH